MLYAFGRNANPEGYVLLALGAMAPRCLFEMIAGSSGNNVELDARMDARSTSATPWIPVGWTSTTLGILQGCQRKSKNT